MVCIIEQTHEINHAVLQFLQLFKLAKLGVSFTI